uniref:CCDC66 domain-containing protein n=1 Tax=Ascaris lumbricoides TaxID=6252 RepID=A0A9J2P9K2_ASCLU
MVKQLPQQSGQFDSLSPPIRIAGESSLDAVPDVQTTQPPFRTPPPEIHQRRTSLVSPPPIRGIYLIETPPPTENIPDSELLLGHLARDDDPDLSRADVVRYNELLPEDPVPSLYTKEEEAVPSLLKYDEATVGLDAPANGIYASDDLGGCREHADDDLCERCKYEQRQMDAMRAEIERRQRATASIKERSQRYVDDFAAKEATFHADEETRKRALKAHIDSVNEEIINRRLTYQEPEFKEVPLLRASEEPAATRRDEKLRYKEDLDRQILSRQKRTLSKREQDIEDSNSLNLATAKALAEARGLRWAQKKHDHEQLRKFHDLQNVIFTKIGDDMEEAKSGQPAELNCRVERTRNNFYSSGRRPEANTKRVQLKAQEHSLVDDPWWVQRPDEHGWKDWKLHAHSSQLERNTRQQDSLLRLADFKRRLEQQDERARNEQKLKYDAIREKIHEQSSLINEPSQHRKGTAREVNEAVVEAWKREWQRNNERAKCFSHMMRYRKTQSRGCAGCLRRTDAAASQGVSRAARWEGKEVLSGDNRIARSETVSTLHAPYGKHLSDRLLNSTDESPLKTHGSEYFK